MAGACVAPTLAPLLAMASSATETQHAASGTRNSSDTALASLPQAILEELIRRLGPGDIAAASATCSHWRAALRSGVVVLAPKSTMALPHVVRHCTSLRSLDLSGAVSAADGSSSPPKLASVLAAVLAALTNLTQLLLAGSESRRWAGCGSLELRPGSLSCLASTPLVQLVDLDISEQPLLHEPLESLAALPRLSRLRAALPPGGPPQSRASWRALAALTVLEYLDISGWDLCQQVDDATAYAPSAAPPVASGEDWQAPAPLQELQGLTRLRGLRLAHWRQPPCADGAPLELPASWRARKHACAAAALQLLCRVGWSYTHAAPPVCLPPPSSSPATTAPPAPLRLLHCRHACPCCAAAVV